MSSPEPGDLDLVREFQNGSDRAFNELVLRHRRAVFTVIVGLIGSADDAEDITQEVFVKAYDALRGFRGDSSLYTWLYRVATNLSLNYLRRRKTRTFLGLAEETMDLPARQSSDLDLETGELADHLRKAISELPEKQRAVFILKHFRGLQHQQIAEMLDRDVGTIKANYFHAVRALRNKLGPYLQGLE